jgi:hypothetical protein
MQGQDQLGHTLGVPGEVARREEREVGDRCEQEGHGRAVSGPAKAHVAQEELRPSQAR